MSNYTNTTYTLVEIQIQQARSHEANVPIFKNALTFDQVHRVISK